MKVHRVFLLALVLIALATVVFGTPSTCTTDTECGCTDDCLDPQ